MKDGALGKDELTDYQTLANNAFVYLNQELGKYFKIVTVPEPATAGIQWAIIDADSSKPVRNTLTTLMPIGIGVSLLTVSSRGWVRSPRKSSAPTSRPTNCSPRPSIGASAARTSPSSGAAGTMPTSPSNSGPSGWRSSSACRKGCRSALIPANTALYNPDARFDWRIIVNGTLDETLYERGTVDRSLPFAELTRRSYINPVAQANDRDPDFSRRIREGLPSAQQESTQ